ncbi:MAG: hypothetical protein HXS47_09575 [Theionarchaea archaeon]|nr:hypothetical protein [Theionarchaea archaeon]
MIEPPLRMMVLVKNDNRNLSIGSLEEDYNERFYESNFRNVAGSADRFELLEEKEKYAIFKITDAFKENESLIGRDVFFSRELTCRMGNVQELPKSLQHNISKNDWVIEITPDLPSIPSGKVLLFQFAFVIDNYVQEEIRRRWESSGKIWSVNFDFHEKIGYESFYEKCSKFFSYPEVFELWIYIPRGHTFTASSPLYDRAFNLDVAETQYKVAQEEFETDENDISVKIMNKRGKPEKFSIICISPNIGEEKLDEIKANMQKFFEEMKRIPTWRDFIQNMMLIVALFSLLIGVVVIFAQQIIQGTPASPSAAPSYQELKGYVSSNFLYLFEICIFVAFTLWGIFSSLKIISKKMERIDLLGYCGLICIGILGLTVQVLGIDTFLSLSFFIICGLFIVLGSMAVICKIKE